MHASQGNTKPYLLLDVDGVLAPMRPTEPPTGYQSYSLQTEEGGLDVLLDPAHGEWLRPLVGLYTFVWATAWEHKAPELIAPLLGLPEMPYIEFTEEPRLDVSWKLLDVTRYIGQAPVAWIDDDLDDRAFEWAASRVAPTRLIQTDRRIGMTLEHIDALWAFAEDLGSAISER